MRILLFSIAEAFAVDIQDNGFISSIPMFSSLLGLMTGTFLLDYLRNRANFSKPLVSIFTG